MPRPVAQGARSGPHWVFGLTNGEAWQVALSELLVLPPALLRAPRLVKARVVSRALQAIPRCSPLVLLERAGAL